MPPLDDLRLFDVAVMLASNALQLYVSMTGFFYAALSLRGLVRSPRPPLDEGPRRRFAVLVPAHDERNVIAFAVDSLIGMDYPRDLFEVIVITDHCTDETATIAAAGGARVLDYAGSGPRGKGFALRWATSQILADSRFDAVCYFDADSLAHPRFLEVMNARLGAGAAVIQGRQVSKNPREGWIARMLCSGHIITARLMQYPKVELGLSATLHGKGMCFAAGVLREHPWDGTCLTEDLDMQMRLVLGGVRIDWSDEAVVYNEEPVTATQYVRRAIRWTAGALMVARRYMGGLFRRALRERDPSAFEAALCCSLAYRLPLASLTALLVAAFPDSSNLLVWMFERLPGVAAASKTASLIPLLLYPAIALFLEGAPASLYLAYLLRPSLGVFRIPIYVCGMFQSHADWARTEHRSRVEIADLVRGGL